MATPAREIVVLARHYQGQMRLLELARQERMLRAWRDIEIALRGSARALADRIIAGEMATSPALRIRLGRYQSLLEQAHAEFDRFAYNAASMIAADQRLAYQLADDVVAATLNAVGAYDVLPTSAVRRFVEFTADPQAPLVKLIKKSWPEAADAMTRVITTAIGTGKGPAKLAGEMMREFGVGLDRALTISRTEVLRAYRHGQQDSYRESEVVVAYKRLSAHDSRVCLGCLFQDGERFDEYQDFDAHPNCRCALVPVIDGIGAPTWKAGADWFMDQPVEKQREMLGHGRWNLWASGEVTDLKDFSMRKVDSEWGGAFVPRPIRDLRTAA